MKKLTLTNKTILALFIILIIASFFRFSNIKTILPGLYPDEAINDNNALLALSTNTLNNIKNSFVIIPLEKNNDTKQIIESTLSNISFKENRYF
ncbi:MAG TPA: hypothetical protein PK168_01890 [Candidatus Paceibacterota bacterium]|jgi:hypothetical protein|nr:hypothetical protein [Candidatus Paceibacterota bacterium]HPC37399.1 hypothetical protein [Candidatus Paceibacterota bacterium]HRU35860.1 hypothetical protein [Candidatus Paceibacterota bacterium]